MTIATYSQEEKIDWILIEDSEIATEYYKVRSENSAWFKFDWKFDEMKHDGKVVRKMLILVKFDCDNKLYSQLSTIFFNDDLEVIAEESLDERSVKIKYVRPNSPMEDLFKTFCNRDKKD
jgi:hypothetical protein